jgi:hypothetical protein
MKTHALVTYRGRARDGRLSFRRRGRLTYMAETFATVTSCGSGVREMLDREQVGTLMVVGGEA